MKKLIITLTTVALGALSACTSHPKNIEANYVSAAQFKNWSCDQVVNEKVRLERQISQKYAHLQTKSRRDKAAVGIGLFVAWPALLFMSGGSSGSQVAYADMKGKYEALEVTYNQKRCYAPQPTATRVAVKSVPDTPVARQRKVDYLKTQRTYALNDCKDGNDQRCDEYRALADQVDELEGL